jgi:putative membrane protein
VVTRVADRRFLRGPRRDVGEDPDYRFSLANERTFLAWIRTALALVAGGLAATQLLPELQIEFAREAIGAGLVGLGTLLAGVAFRRWAINEEAMRLGRPIPASRLPAVLAVGVAVVSVGALLLLLADEVVGS